MLASNKINTYLTFTLLLLTAWVTFVAYQPGLNGPFVFDDGPNISENPALRISSLTLKELHTAINAIQAGPLGRPISYVSFALNYYFFGPNTFSFKLTNLMIHLVNGFTVFILTRLLLRGFRFAYRVNLSKPRIQWIALSVSSLWLLHPLALTTIFLVVQRMTSFSALFTMWAIIFYVCGRLKQMTGQPGLSLAAFGLFFCAPLAVLSKENAVLIPYFLVAIEFCLLRYKTRSSDFRVVFGGILLIAVVPLVGTLFTFESLWNWLLRSYEIRPYTLYEHVLTESRVIWFYINLVILPRPSEFGLYHDDIVLSTDVLTPYTTIASIAGLIGIVVGALALRGKAPVLSFAILFFLIGHAIESSIFSLEIAHEHRNYLPMYGILFALSYYGLHLKTLGICRSAAIIGLICLTLTYATITYTRATQWRNAGELAFSLVRDHPHSARSNYEAGKILAELIENSSEHSSKASYYSLSREYFTSSYKSDPTNPSGLFAILYIDSLVGKATDQTIVEKLKYRLATQPILPAVQLSFSHLHQCLKDQQRCTVDEKMLAGLYQTALIGNRTSKKTRASLLNELAIVELQLGNQKMAFNHFEKAIESMPSQPQLWFNLIQVLVNKGKFEEAMQRMATAKQRFTGRKSQKKIATLEKLYSDQLRIAESR